MKKEQLYSSIKQKMTGGRCIQKIMQDKYKLGTIPNRKQTIAELKHVQELVDFELQQLEQKANKKIEVKKQESYQCIICYEELKEPLSMCIDSRHSLCQSCIQSCLDKKFDCPMCKQNKMDQIDLYCFKTDRKNINGKHMREIIFQDINFDKLIQEGQIQYKWLQFQIRQNISINAVAQFNIYIETDRHKKIQGKDLDLIPIFFE